jgi:hypothetical protein
MSSGVTSMLGILVGPDREEPSFEISKVVALVSGDVVILVVIELVKICSRVPDH